MSKWGPGYEISFSFRISNWDTVGIWDNVFVVTTNVHGNDMRHPGLWINNGGQSCNKDSSKIFWYGWITLIRAGLLDVA